MSNRYCHKPLPSRSKFATAEYPRCNGIEGHGGKCQEFPFLQHLKSVAPKVADKVQRDATMTTGAPWKSDEAGPNRILRYAMMLSDRDLIRLGVPIQGLEDHVIQKLRAKSAPYGNCIRVAEYLTLQVYEMPDAPLCPDSLRVVLEEAIGRKLSRGTTTCLICKSPMSFELFELARRGKAEVETAHANPREHLPGNVGFAHRFCNIAQGDKDLEDFYTWVSGLLQRNGWTTTPPQ